ncbi:MAG: sulfatase family protein [Planctomycetota bacterium]|jgi:N-sulfoglucosamine sulfohydrolase
MKRRDFIKLAGLSAVSMSFAEVFGGQQQSHGKPDIVLIVSDDHGLELGCYGNNVIKTPNMDKLACEGTVFTHAFCTTASCSASRSVILTGLYNHATGQYGHAHGYHHFKSYEDIKSLPVLLGECGYRTGRIGKYHVEPESVYKFDNVIKANSRSPVEMANLCSDFIKSKDNQPFFLYFCTSDPHRCPQPDTVTPNKFGNRPKGYKGVKAIKYDPDEVQIPSFLPNTKECREELAQYYQSVSRVDQGMGKLLDILKKADKYDNTLIIYISDNGIAFPGAKTTVYEPGIHLPCIVRQPGQRKKGIKCDAMITWADLAPTILDFAGAIPNKNKFHGRSFKSVVEKEKTSNWDEIYASHTFHEITMYYPMRVVRQRKYKLIWNIAYEMEYPFATDLWVAPTWQSVLNKGGGHYGKRKVKDYLRRAEFELYDLEKDPDEIHNLADNPEYSEILEKLKKKIKDFQTRTRDPWIIKWEHEDIFRRR